LYLGCVSVVGSLLGQNHVTSPLIGPRTAAVLPGWCGRPAPYPRTQLHRRVPCEPAVSARRRRMARTGRDPDFGNRTESPSGHGRTSSRTSRFREPLFLGALFRGPAECADDPPELVDLLRGEPVE